MNSVPDVAPEGRPHDRLALLAAWAAARPWTVLLLAAIAARAITFGNPIVHVDEQFYFATAHAMWRGAIPYVDVWDRKPIGLFLIYLLPARLGFPAGIWAYQLLALASLVATARLVVAIAARAGLARGAMFAGFAYVVWPDLLEGQGGQSPIFYNLLVACVAWLLIQGRPARLCTAAPAMLLIGLALQVKYSVVFEGVFFGLWCMAATWREERKVGLVLIHGAVLAGLALLPTLGAIGAYAAIGHLDAYWHDNFIAILRRQPDPLAHQLADLAGMALIISPLVAMAALAARHGAAGPERTTRTFTLAWLGASLFGVLAFGTWFPHYALPILVPAAICAAGIRDRSSAARRWSMIALLAAALGGQVLLAIKLIQRGGAGEFGALVREARQGSGCLYVYSGPPMLYAAAGRCRATRFAFPSSLTRTREAAAIGVDPASELRRVFASKPGTVIVQPPFEGESGISHAVMTEELSRGYRLRSRLPLGNQMLDVYDRRPELAASDR